MKKAFFQKDALRVLKPAAIGFLDADLNLISLNKAMSALFQVDPAALKGAGYLDFLPGPDLELWRAGLKRAASQGPEFRLCLKTSLASPLGPPLKVRVTVDALNLEGGRSGGFLTVWEEAGPSRLSCRKRQQAADSYRLFFNHLPVPAFYFSLSPAGQVTVNQALADLLGYGSRAEAEAALGGGRLLRHLGREQARSIRADIACGQRLIGRPVQCRRLDGSYFDGALTVSVTSDAWDEIQSIDGYLEDVTLKNQAQEAFTRAKDAAESADRAKSEFLANISHELRTPLNIIIGMSGMTLESPQLAPELAESLAMINQAGEELLNRINDLIAVGDLGAGRLKSATAPFTIPALLNALLGALEKRARAENVELLVESNVDQNLILMADHKLINMVLAKLIHNAIKFSARGRGRVRVSASLERLNEAGAQAALLISVSDSGPGLPEKNRDNLFQDFTQGDSSNTRHYGGLGVGLYLARGLTELMNGRLTARNRPEGGAEFILNLPVRLFRNEDEEEMFKP